MSETVEVSDKVALHQRRYKFIMSGLMISFVVDMIVVAVVMGTNGSFDPGVFLYLPVVATFAFGILAVWAEVQAKKAKVVVEYFPWLFDKILGKEVK